jgi:hypothetical protein
LTTGFEFLLKNKILFSYKENTKMSPQSSLTTVPVSATGLQTRLFNAENLGESLRGLYLDAMRASNLKYLSRMMSYKQGSEESSPHRNTKM